MEITSFGTRSVGSVARRNYQFGTGSRPWAATLTDGTEVILKGGDHCPEHPFCAANEIYAWLVGELVGLPALPAGLVRGRDSYYFASAFQEEINFPPFEPSMILTATNSADRYLIVVNDVAILNTDRHDNNLRGLVTASGTRLIANDHDRSFFRQGEGAQQIMDHQDDGIVRNSLIPIQSLRESIVDPAMLENAILRFESLSRRILVGALSWLPSDFQSADEKNLVIDFLLYRISRLREFFQEDLRWFPNLPLHTNLVPERALH